MESGWEMGSGKARARALGEDTTGVESRKCHVLLVSIQIIDLGYLSALVRFLWTQGLEGDGSPLRVFKWTGKNDYVALCENDYISFGGGLVYLCCVSFH